MNEHMHKAVTHYATMVLEWLDADAKYHEVPRPALVELFTDTINALEQAKEQED